MITVQFWLHICLEILKFRTRAKMVVPLAHLHLPSQRQQNRSIKVSKSPSTCLPPSTTPSTLDSPGLSWTTGLCNTGFQQVGTRLGRRNWAKWLSAATPRSSSRQASQASGRVCPHQHREKRPTPVPHHLQPRAETRFAGSAHEARCSN